MAEQTRIGKTDLYVTPIGFGANYVGGHNLYPNLDEEVGEKLVHKALDNGINLLDTAYHYGPKRSEELIGEVIKERGNRSDVVIATKGSHKYSENTTIHDNSPAYLRQSVEDSLKRLQTDYIDLYYIHFPDNDTPKDEAVGALKQLKDEGKIRAIGLSNFSMEQIKEANKDGYVDVIQGNYSLLQREAEKELLPYTVEQGISFIPYFPLALGLLAGNYTKDMVFDDLRAKKSFFEGEEFAKNIDKVEQLRDMAARKQTEIVNLVLAWYLTRPSINVLIPGAKKPEQILSNLKTLEVELTGEDINAIDQLFR